MAYLGKQNPVALYDSYTKAQAMSLFGSPYANKDIGEPFGIWDHLTGVEPPDNSGAAKFVRLTAGQDGPGGYNEGLLINETVVEETSAGAGPTITAEIAVGPNAGDVINLINSENRYLMPGESSGAVADDQMQQITGSFGTVRADTAAIFEGAFDYIGDTGSIDTGTFPRGNVSFNSDDSPDARTGDKTNVKHGQITKYLRIA